MQEKILLYGKSQRNILYGEKDNLTAYGTIFEFVQRTNSTLSIMKNGEHWFHTDEQMKFLDEWIIKIFQNKIQVLLIRKLGELCIL